MVDEPSGFCIGSGGSLDCTISDVVVAIGVFLVVGLLDPRDDVPARQANFLNNTTMGARESRNDE